MVSCIPAPKYRLFAPAAVLFAGGCAWESVQSTLHPAGPAAAEIAWLWWFMFWAFTAVFALVVMLLACAIMKRPRSLSAGNGPIETDDNRPPLGGTRFIVAGGILLPVVVLTPLFLLSLNASATLNRKPEGLTIRVIGHMWWWEVRYPEQRIVTANEIHIPAGQPVRLELTSADVIHSFWVPRLHGKRDLIPGLTTVFWIQADQPGVYRGQCAEYCGTQHANMAFHVVALPKEQFDTWLAAPGKARPTPANADDPPGYRVFLKAGCGQCHAIDGTPAIGTAGPDLTHVGSRGSIGAGMLPNNRGNLAGWVANPQAIKPGAKMPRTYLSGDDLTALVSYLEGLK
jgi:cytochrome c oxidase subunit II